MSTHPIGNDEGIEAFRKTLPPHTMRCPKCGHTCTDHEGLIIDMLPFSGAYCMRCWCKWASENIPRLVPIEPKKEAKDE